MRLINMDTMKLEEFIGNRIPNYFILSHTWEDEEISFHEYNWLYEHNEEEIAGIIDEMLPKQRSRFRAKAAALQSRTGYIKIRESARLARDLKNHTFGDSDLATTMSRDMLQRCTVTRYIWVDTCCINKESSAELSEAINSMYCWYRDAVLCIAYLSDVKSDSSGESEFAESRWFTRGWTLQELLAPAEVLFFNQQWVFITQKRDATEVLGSITKIEKEILTRDVPISTQPAAKVISWAARRQTTRVEDEAYCLLGLLGVNMPLLYGEGSRAFYRLQKVVMDCCLDESLFAWGYRLPIAPSPRGDDMCAISPREFAWCGGISFASGDAEKFWGRILEAPHRVTNAGLEATVLVAAIPFGDHGIVRTYAILPILIDDYPVCVPLVEEMGQHLRFEDIHEDTRLIRPKTEQVALLFRLPPEGAVFPFKTTRRKVIVNRSYNRGIVYKQLSSDQKFNLGLRLDRGLCLVEMWSSYMLPTGGSTSESNAAVSMSYVGWRSLHEESADPILFRIRIERRGPQYMREYVVALRLKSNFRLKKWMRIRSWESVALSSAPSMCAVFLNTDCQADDRWWEQGEGEDTGIVERARDKGSGLEIILSLAREGPSPTLISLTAARAGTV